MAENDDANQSPDDRGPPTNETDVDPLVEIAARLSELKAFVAHLAEVKVDQARLWTRQLFVGAIVWSLLGLAIVVGVSVATIYIARGLALGFSAWCGGRLWLGYLLSGVLLLGFIAVGLWVMNAAYDRRRRREIIEKYEAKRDHQESELGFSVDDVDAELHDDGDDTAARIASGSTGDELRGPSQP